MKISVKTFATGGAFLFILAGVFGMLFSYPFLYSSNMADLVGAGLPFVGGAVLAAGGMISLAILYSGKESGEKGE